MVDVRVTVAKNPIPDVIASVRPPLRRQLFRFIGSYVSRLAKDNARAKGGRKFWKQIANSVRMEAYDEGAVIGATHYAASHKHAGGAIAAPGKGPMSRKREFLTIPITDKAKGRNANDFTNTFIANSKAGNPIIFKKLSDGGIFPLFVLKKSVFQKAYPWFPEPGEPATDAAIRRGAEQFFKKQIGV